MKGLDLDGILEDRSRRKLSFLPIARMASTFDMRLAVHTVTGAKAGPTLALFATEHGDEHLGMSIIREVLASLSPEDLSGQVVAVPLASPLAFEMQTYHTPQDMKSIHVLFPGNPKGSLSEKMAFLVTEEILNKVDCLVNLHGGGMQTVNDFVYVPQYAGKVGEATLEIAKSFGQKVLYLGPAVPGCATTYAAETKGIPGICDELGSDVMWPSTLKEFVTRGTRGVRNVLIHLGMLRGKVERPREPQLLVRERTCLKSEQGGLFIPEFGIEALGRVVPKGTVLGRILDASTFEEVERLTTPYDKGILFLVRGYSRVHAGDYMFHVGNMATAEELR